MKQVAIVTGALGFLGSHIANYLAESGFRVIGVGRNDVTGRSALNSDVEFIHCSLPDVALEEILAQHKPALFVHAAGSASIESSLRDPYQDFKTSTDVTAFVLEAIRKSCPETHFVLLSSAAVYGAPETLPISESHPENPISPYGFHKLMAELLAREATQFFGLKCTIFRIFSAYGERIKRQVIFDLCSKFTQNAGSITLSGTGEETRDFIHAHDVARATAFAYNTAAYGLYNLATGLPTTISDLANILKSKFVDARAIAFNGIVPPGMPRYWRADVSKITARGFLPAISLDKGIEQFCRWFQSSQVTPLPTALITLPTSQSNSSTTKIGFSSMGTWMGGIAYLDILTKSLAALPSSEKPRMVLVVTDSEGFELHANIIARMDEVLLVGTKFGTMPHVSGSTPAIRQVTTIEEAIESVDVFYPVNSNVHSSPKAISWIPDFQHLYLPHLFSKETREHRDACYQLVANRAAHVVFSSEDAAKDFAKIAPNASAVSHVLRFYSLPEQEWYAHDARAVQCKYSLPQKFLICCNQFWEHKNHLTLFKAIKILRDHGVNVPLVCTGAVTESRNPEYIEKVKATISEFGIGDLVHILGELPRAEQLQLMRAAAAVVQPSLFEGWSTVVEDARVFGKTIFLSDLPVHREQSPRWAIYFDPKNPMNLAEKIVEEAAVLQQGPHQEREEEARVQAVSFASDFARTFLRITEAVLESSPLHKQAENSRSALF